MFSYLFALHDVVMRDILLPATQLFTITQHRSFLRFGLWSLVYLDFISKIVCSQTLNHCYSASA